MEQSVQQGAAQHRAEPGETRGNQVEPGHQAEPGAVGGNQVEPGRTVVPLICCVGEDVAADFVLKALLQLQSKK